MFKVPVAKVRVPGPETNPWYWHPNRAGVRKAPSWFMEQLERVGEELEVTWNPLNERWQVWSRAPRVQHKICQGWRLLFIHNGPSGEHLPLDERLLARLYASSVMEHGSAREYFNRISSEMKRDREKAREASKQETIDKGMEIFDHSQIKVSMAGKSSGSKFSTYHA